MDKVDKVDKVDKARRKFLSISFLTLSTLSTLSTSSTFAAERDIRLTEIKGTVSVLEPGASDWQAVPEGTVSVPLEEGEKVKTGPGSEATIIMDQDNTIELDAHTVFEIQSAQTGWTKFKLGLGKMLAKIEEKLEQNNRRMNIITYTSVLAVRGTEFAVEIPKQAASGTAPADASEAQEGLAVFEGSVDATLTQLENTPTVRVEKEQELDLTRSGPAPRARVLRRFLAHKKRMLLMRKKHARLRAKWRRLPLERRRAIRDKLRRRVREQTENPRQKKGRPGPRQGR